MSDDVVGIHHVQVTVSPEVEAESVAFYRDALGLFEFPKPAPLMGNGGAWFRVGDQELHVSPEPGSMPISKRHFCLRVVSLSAVRLRLERFGISIEEDAQPFEGWVRFYVRDPAGNRIELAEI